MPENGIRAEGGDFLPLWMPVPAFRRYRIIISPMAAWVIHIPKKGNVPEWR
jgi:hypothetical protein